MTKVLVGRATPFALLLLLLLAGIIIMIPDDGEAIGEIGVTVELDEGSVDVDVSPGRGGIVTVTGIVRALWLAPDLISYQYIIVNLEVDAGGFMVTEIPELYLVKPPSTDLQIIESLESQRPFSFSLMVESGTPYSGASDPILINVEGSWGYNIGVMEGSVDVATLMISVEQYYHYKVECETQYVQTHPGGEFEIELEVFNEGNGPDGIELEVENREMMEDRGWTIQMSVSEFDLPMGGSVKIPVRVTTPVKWEPWRNRVSVIRFIVHSSQAEFNLETSEVAHLSVFIRQRGVSIPGFEPVLFILALLTVAVVRIKRRR